MRKYLIAKLSNKIDNHIINNNLNSVVFLLIETNHNKDQLLNFIKESHIKNNNRLSEVATLDIFESSIDLAKERLEKIISNYINLKNISNFKNYRNEEVKESYFNNNEYKVIYTHVLQY